MGKDNMIDLRYDIGYCAVIWRIHKSTSGGSLGGVNLFRGVSAPDKVRVDDSCYDEDGSNGLKGKQVLLFVVEMGFGRRCFFLYSWGFDEHEHWCSCEITALLLCPYGFVNKVYPTVIAVSIGLLMILMIKQWIEGYIISRQTHRVDNILISKKHVFKLWFTFGQS